MSVREHPGLAALARRAPLPSTSGRRSVESAAGIAALSAAAGAAAWISVGVAAGPRWIELPAGSRIGWIEGPLHGIASGLGSLPSAAASAPLLVLAAAYLIALGCARGISVRAALFAVGLANLAFTLGPTIVSSDVFGYVAYARELTVHGLNPYVSAPTALGHEAILHYVYWQHEASPYGPLFTVLSAPLGLVSPGAALWVYKALAGLASFAIALVVARIARQRGLDSARAAIFVGLNPVILFYAVSGAHNDLLAVLFVICAFALVHGERGGAGAGRRVWAGGGAGAGGGVAVAAAAIKVTVGLALPFVLIIAHARKRGRAATSGSALALLAIGIVAAALFGTHLFDQLQKITSDSRFDIAWSGPDRLARALGTHITPAIRAICTSAAAIVAVAMLVRAWRGADPIAAAGWAFLALLGSIASLTPWYLIWLLPLAALGRSRALWIAALLASGYLLAVHLPALGGELWLSGP